MGLKEPLLALFGRVDHDPRGDHLHGVMLLASGAISAFVNRHLAVKMLALASSS